MPKRAWIISTELEYLVVAETEDQAKEMAKDELATDCLVGWPENWDAKPANHLPGLYETGDSISVFGGGSMLLAETVRLPGGYKYEEPKKEVES